MTHPAITAAMTEAEVQRVVTDALDAHHWRWCHFESAVRQSGRWATPLSGHKGFGDIIAVKPPRCLYLELKTERGYRAVVREHKATEAQRAWMADMVTVGGVTALWVAPSTLDAALEEIGR